MRTSLLDSLAWQREQRAEVLERDRREWLVKTNKQWNKRVRFPQQSSPELIIIRVMPCIMPVSKMRQRAVESAGNQRQWRANLDPYADVLSRVLTYADVC